MVAQFFRIQLPHLIEIENMGENDKYRKCNSKSLQYVIYWITPTQTLNADQNINIITISVFTDDTARPEVKKRFYANSQDPGLKRRKI